MMEEYELNSEPSERLSFEDEDYDYPPGYVPSDDKSSKNLIGSAKDVILNMVNNIAANVLGGNPEDVARSGGNYSSLDLNVTETPEAPQTVPPSASYIVLETVEQDQHDLNGVTETTSITQDTIDVEETVPLPTATLSETPSATLEAPESLTPTPTEEEQIVTLLPKEEEDESNELDQSEQSTRTIPQEEEQKVKTEKNQRLSGLQESEKCCKQAPDSCSCLVSLEEYLLQNCVPLPSFQKKKKKMTSKVSKDSQSQLNTHSQEVHTSVPVTITSSQTLALHTWTVEASFTPEVSTSPVFVPPLPASEKHPQAGSLDLEPSLTSALPKPTSTDNLASKVTHAVDFLDSSVTEPPELTLPQHEKTKEKPAEAKETPLLTSHSESASAPVLKTKSVETDRDQKPTSAAEKTTEWENLTPSVTSSIVDQTPLTPLSSPTDQFILHPAKTKTGTPAETLTAAPVTEPLEGTGAATEFKTEELLEEGGNGQAGQQSSSDFYAELPSSTDAPVHGSNQKESVFMRLNNRIKALEVNMSLSGRYLEQLSQRYRKQMEEMQKAFNKTIIKLQNTSRIAEEQDQKQTESIQALQGQLENMTQLVLNLSVRVSQLQKEVSDRHSYLLLSVVLCFLLCLAVCINFFHMSAETSSTEPDASTPQTYSYCCPDSASFGYEDVSLKRRASYPFSQSSLQIPAAEGPNEAYNVETQRSSVGHKKQKKRSKMKSTTKPETITPTVLSVTSVPNGKLHSNRLPPQGLDFTLSSRGPGPSPFSFNHPQSEGSSEASSQSDEPSFCGLPACGRICEGLPPPKSRSEKRAFKRRRSKTACTVVQQLLQPPPGSAPLVRPGPTMQGLIKTTTELSTGRVGVTTISGLT